MNKVMSNIETPFSPKSYFLKRIKEPVSYFMSLFVNLFLWLTFFQNNYRVLSLDRCSVNKSS